MAPRRSWRRPAAAFLLAAALSVVAVGASGSFASATAAGGNLDQARADLNGLSMPLARAIGRIQADERLPRFRRRPTDLGQMLRALTQSSDAAHAGASQFPSVFGLPYSATFSQLDCVETQIVVGEQILRELQQRRLAAAPGSPSVYVRGAVLADLRTAAGCRDSLERELAKGTGVPPALGTAVRGLSARLARAIGPMTSGEQRPSGTRVAVNAAQLLQALKRSAAADLDVARGFPEVFTLPYSQTFAQLDCVDSQITAGAYVLRELRQGRLASVPGTRNAYALGPALVALQDARGCERSLARELAQVAGGASTSTTTQTQTPPNPSGGPGPTASPSSSATGPSQPIYLDTHYSFAQRAADLVSRMTLAEKIAQLRTNNAAAIPRLGVQQYTYWNEGQHGINALGADTNPGGASGGPHATSFPTNFAATMSWDPQLIYQETTAISDEVRGFLDKSLWSTGQNNLGPAAADYGSLTYWAPTVNMDRDPRWGRTDEAFGEDPYLVSRMAGAFVDGYQGQTIDGQPMSPYLKVAATAKHFALNNIEDNRQVSSSDVSDTDLHDYYTAQFRSLIEDAHVSGLMTSLNAINGTPSMADTYTTNQVAGRTYGFNGYTTSDCALSNIYRSAPNGHNWAPPDWSTDGQDLGATWTNGTTGVTVSGAAGSQAYALRSGTDLNCPGTQATLSNIQSAINAGILSEGVIDNALVKLFTIRMMTGEFDPPSQVSYTKTTKDVIQSPAHQALARQLADNSLVLLKNDDLSGTTTPLLPANAATLQKVVILGDLAGRVTLGGYSGSPSLQVDAVQGITSAMKAANPNATIYYDPAGTSTTSTTAVSLSAQTQQQIKSADLVIVFVGTDAAVTGEGHDRTTLAMPGNYDSLISQVAAQGNSRMALVIQSDGPVDITTDQRYFPAVLFSGYNGESQGDGLADVLFGNQNPSGHLDFTWYADDSQLPPISDYNLAPSSGTSSVPASPGRTYMYFTGAPTYPFGYGLSYTKFSFSNLQVGPQQVSADGAVNVSFDVTNTGSVPGAAVAQLYAATPPSLGSGFPVKRLEGFQKTAVLNPGQTQLVSLTVPVWRLEFWDQHAAKWVVDDGTYQFELGSDSSNIAASQPVAVIGSLTPHVQYVTVQAPSVAYKPGDTLDLTGKDPWIADDTNPSLEQRNLGVTADNIVEAVNNDGSFVDLNAAQVSYASSNEKVATVSSSGVLTAAAPGVATISVTVDGVTGSAVIVVKHPLALTTPAVVLPGSSFSATETLLNTGSSPLTNVNLSTTPPGGWTASPTSSPSFSSIPAGGSAQVMWTIAAPAGATPGTYELDATADSQTGNGDDAETYPAVVSIPYQSLSASFDNAGESDDSAPGAGNLDGGGRSYSAQAAAGVGLTPGATFTHDGLSFTWPPAPAGTADNVIAAGQTIPLSGSGTRLGFLGTGDYGTASGTGTITYSDGSTQSFGLSFADWWSNKAAPGGDILATMQYVNVAGGQKQQQASVYYDSVSLQADKTVRYVTLPPDVTQGGAGGHTTMHIFAIAIG